MNCPDNDLLDERQDSQEQKENEGPVQRWNNEWKIFKVPDRGSVNPTPLGGLGQRHFAA